MSVVFIDSLDQLRVFYYVAKNESMTLAAKELFVTQPAVSHAVTLLEERLGSTLFVRSRPKMRLTTEGRLLYEGVRSAFDELNKARQRIDAVQALQEGVVDIGATHLVMRYYLVPFLSEFHRLYPHIKLRMVTENMHELTEFQKAGRTDLAIIATSSLDLPQDRELEFEPLSMYRYVFIAERSHYEFLQGKQLTFTELAQYPIIALKKGTLTRDYLDNYFRAQNLLLNVDFEVDMMSMVVDFTRYGFGIGAVISPVLHQAKNWGLDLIEVKLTQNFAPGRLVLVKRKNSPLTRAAEAVANIIREGAQALQS